MSTGAMSMSAKIAIGLIVVIALGSSQSFAAPQTLSGSEIQFTRCDNSTEPLGKIEISACTGKKDFCIFRYGTWITAEIEFTPGSVGAYVCAAEGAKCPMEAGVKQHIKAKIHVVMVSQYKNKAKLFMSDDKYLLEPYWYCVEFPARLV